MSFPWLSTWGSTTPFAFSYPRVTTSCSYILSIVFYNSIFVLETFIFTDVSSPLTLACTCSPIFSFKANASASSTLAYTCCLITPTYTSPFIAPPTPFIDLVRACWFATSISFSSKCASNKEKPKKSKTKWGPTLFDYFLTFLLPPKN